MLGGLQVWRYACTLGRRGGGIARARFGRCGSHCRRAGLETLRTGGVARPVQDMFRTDGGRTPFVVLVTEVSIILCITIEPC